MFQSITLFKLDAASCNDETRDEVARKLRTATAAAGYDALVGLPSDAASLKSWDLAFTVSFRTQKQVEAFDSRAFMLSATGLGDAALVVTKGWSFATAPSGNG